MENHQSASRTDMLNAWHQIPRKRSWGIWEPWHMMDYFWFGLCPPCSLCLSVSAPLDSWRVVEMQHISRCLYYSCSANRLACVWMWHTRMLIVCPEVTESWSTVCSVLSSKDAKNNHAYLLEGKDMLKLQLLRSFRVCKQLCTKKNSLPRVIEKRQT